ncbi:unnamed protein product [Urochloa humidicola]
MGKSSLASIAAVAVTLAVFVAGCHGIEVWMSTLDRARLRTPEPWHRALPSCGCSQISAEASLPVDGGGRWLAAARLPVA